MPKTFEEWKRSPGIYASYGDYVRGMRASEEYYRRLEREKLAKEVAHELIRAVRR